MKAVSIFATSTLVFLALMIVLSTSAFAASVTNVEYSNGDVTTQGTAGNSIGGKVRIVVPANEVVEMVQFDVITDSLSPVCVAVGGDKGLEEGTHFVNISDVKFPPNTGTYSLEVKASGIFGAFKTIDCTSNIVASNSFGGSIKTVGSSSSSSEVGSSMYDKLMAQIAALTAQVAALSTPKPADKPACPPVGSTNTVQAWLLASPYAAPFHAIGVYAPTNFWGGATQSSYDMAIKACK